MAPPSDAPGAQSRPARNARDRTGHSIGREVALLAVVGVLAALLVRAFVVQAYMIPSGSMRPLLEPGDRVVVLSLGQEPGELRRGDVVVFDGTGLFSPAPSPDRSPLQVAKDALGHWFGATSVERDFVKRIIGLPGERIVCCDADGRITVDGRPLDEPYLYPGDDPSELRFDVLVPEGRLWLMGDHRSDSADSRAHLGEPGGGMVPMSRVIGRVVSIAWPVSRWGGVPRWEYVPPQDGGAVGGDR